MRYSRLLEEGDFRGRTAHYVLMLLFGTTVISMVASYINVHFLGSALTFMMAYVWGRRNEDVKVRERERKIQSGHHPSLRSPCLNHSLFLVDVVSGLFDLQCPLPAVGHVDV